MPSGPASANLAKQIENVRAFGVPAVVAINAFPIRYARPSTRRSATRPSRPVPAMRSSRPISSMAATVPRTLAAAVWAAAEEGAPNFAFLYPDDAPIANKIETVAERIYGADGVDLLPAAAKAIKQIEAWASDTCPSTWPRRSTR